MDSAGRAECRLPFCALWTENDKNIFCKSHTTRWRNLGFPDVEEFVADCERHGQWVIDLRVLPAALRLELQYALQCRNDEQSATAPPRVVRWAIRRAVESGVASLLDHSEAEWRQLLAERRTPGDGGLRARTDSFLLFARETVETLRDGIDWEIEYHRDIWRLWRLPGLKTSASRPRPRSHLRFDRITQPWMRELSKRWVRWRLVSGLTVIAKAKGKLRGKQPKLKPGQAREVRRMHDSGDYTVVEIAEMFNISRPTVYRTLDRIPTFTTPTTEET